jgi:hypothetical protein
MVIDRRDRPGLTHFPSRLRAAIGGLRSTGLIAFLELPSASTSHKSSSTLVSMRNQRFSVINQGIGAP